VSRNFRPGLILPVAGMLVSLLAVSGCIAQAPSSGGAQSSGGFDWSFIIIIVIFAAAVYFLMIRPQRNQQKKQQKLLSELSAGDRVITAGGIYGEIDSIDDDSVVLKVESGAKIRVMRTSIAGKRPEQ
jgi:preprotein translocase subunit YajC